MIKKLIFSVTLLVVTLSTQALADTPTVEWAPFNVKAGVSEQVVINQAQTVEDLFLKQQPGYIRRSLLNDGKGQWVDVVYWESKVDASNAMKKAFESPICHQYFALMEGTEDGEVSPIKHYRLVQSWQ